mgnify:CR=1 FL=1
MIECYDCQEKFSTEAELKEHYIDCDYRNKRLGAAESMSDECFAGEKEEE